MPDVSPDATFIDRIFASAGPLVQTGAAGVYGRSALHERAVAAITRLIERLGETDNAEILRFPPVLTRRDFERTGYFKNFAPLTGTIHCFCGDDEDLRAQTRLHDAGEDWTGLQRASDLVLTPAACYPVYPAIAGRQPFPADGTIIDAASWCFRREPSSDPARQQFFRMHERIFIGRADGSAAFRATWRARAESLATALSLPFELALANDPFFGVTGRLMARLQRDQQLKHELLIPLTDPAAPTACASVNDHLTKMSAAWNLRLSTGELAHTACAGFGLDRLALAIFHHHGFEPAAWPKSLAAHLA